MKLTQKLINNLQRLDNSMFNKQSKNIHVLIFRFGKLITFKFCDTSISIYSIFRCQFPQMIMSNYDISPIVKPLYLCKVLFFSGTNFNFSYSISISQLFNYYIFKNNIAL